jgi:hypothetical protein
MGKKGKLDTDKKLCKLAKDDAADTNFDEYAALVSKPRFICRKCGRAAKEKGNLCKPEKISD